MTLIIEIPDTRAPEHDYILSVILGEFLGLSWQRVPSDRKDVRITMQGHQGEIRMPDILLQTPDEHWLTPQSLPAKPLPVWDSSELGLPITLVDRHLPVIYGETKSLDNSESSSLETSNLTLKTYIPLDFFGSAFFMLTRYEEIIKPDRDEHDRFPAWVSLAYQENFLERPIVDEYTEVLWAVMKNLWPGLERKKQAFGVFPTHDVDNPFDPSVRSVKKLLRSLGGDFLKRHSPKQAMDRMLQYAHFKSGRGQDPYDTFDWLMEQSEKVGLQSAFYFKAAQNGPFDSAYSLNHPRIRNLLQEIPDRGHEVGFHPGYRTSENQDLWMQELMQLKDALPESNRIRGGRQHFLMFTVPKTWRFWADAGLSYEATLGFADHAGFRCGTCHPFSPFDLKRQEKLNITERPLIAMECTVLDEKYMGMQPEHAINYMLSLKERCALFGGEFVFLWHNSRLTTKAEKEMYKAVIGTHMQPGTYRA